VTYSNGKSDLRWKLAMTWLHLRHPLWCWRLRRECRAAAVSVPPHTFGGQP
jgi:hypothetical protein